MLSTEASEDFRQLSDNKGEMDFIPHVIEVICSFKHKIMTNLKQCSEGLTLEMKFKTEQTHDVSITDPSLTAYLQVQPMPFMKMVSKHKYEQPLMRMNPDFAAPTQRALEVSGMALELSTAKLAQYVFGPTFMSQRIALGHKGISCEKKEEKLYFEYDDLHERNCMYAKRFNMFLYKIEGNPSDVFSLHV